jgi:hypothetical protein
MNKLHLHSQLLCVPLHSRSGVARCPCRPALTSALHANTDTNTLPAVHQHLARVAQMGGLERTASTVALPEASSSSRKLTEMWLTPKASGKVGRSNNTGSTARTNSLSQGLSGKSKHVPSTFLATSTISAALLQPPPAS